MPSERDLAAQAHISRSAVHLAMSELEHMGFVETNGSHGTYVTDFARKGNIDTLNLLIRFNGADFSYDKISDLLEMRMAIEGTALKRLCSDLNNEKIHILEEDTEKAETCKDAHSLAEAFFNFHHDICVCSGNFILPLLFNTFRFVTLAYWEEAIRKLGREKCLSFMHGLLEKIREKNADEASAYLRHEFSIFIASEKSQSVKV